MDGDHTAWIIVEADSKEEVKFVIPVAYRPQAKIVKLNKFSLAEMDKFLAHHPE